jgi:putative transposase
MARLARAVAPGYPHHVIQRGNRRQQVFFEDGDYVAYRELLAAQCERAGVAVWAYCLMPNHIHLILVPAEPDGLRAAVAETHRRYSRRINSREDWRGHLWQERFASFAMDEVHLIACAHYIEMNPVRGGLAGAPEDWAWSSARAHLAGADDELVAVAPMLDLVDDWAAYLQRQLSDDSIERLRRHGRSGRPAGGDGFVRGLEQQIGRRLRPGKPGRPRKPAV